MTAQTFSAVKTLDYAFSFFLEAQRAFISADNFFLAAALIAGRALVFLGAALPFHFAQRCFIASEIRVRAAALIVRRFWRVAGAVCDGGAHGEERMGQRVLRVQKWRDPCERVLT